MLLGFNLLLWTPFVTEAQFPLFERLKTAGYDGVELPLFDGTPEHYRRVGEAVRAAGLRCTAVAIIPDEARNCASADAASRAAGLAHLRWAIDCLQAAGGEVLCGPFHQPLGVFSGAPPTGEELARVAEVQSAAATHAAAAGIQLAVEPLNRFECYLLNTVEASARLVEAVGQPNYGILYTREGSCPLGPHARRVAHWRLRRLVRDRGLRARSAGDRRGYPGLARLLPLGGRGRPVRPRLPASTMEAGRTLKQASSARAPLLWRR